MSNVVELLSTLIDQVTPSKNHTSDEWSNIVSLIKNNLNESRELISNSSEPLEESLSSVLTTLRSNRYTESNLNSAVSLIEPEPDPFENQVLYTPKSDEKTETQYNEVVSRANDYSEDDYPRKRRYSLTAVFRAFFGRSRTEEFTFDDNDDENNNIVPYEYKEEGTERVPPLDFNLLSGSDQFASPNKADLDASKEADLSGATPASILETDNNGPDFNAGTSADAAADAPDCGINDLDDGASGTDEPVQAHKTDEAGAQLSSGPDAVADDYAKDFVYKMKEHRDFMYTPLREISSDSSKLNLYLVATEMIKSKLLIYKRKLNVFNYNAVDPSIYFNQAYVYPEVDYSIQIVAPMDGRQHHINFGDIIRLKRVDAHVKLDRGKKYVNILVPDRCNPTIRAWRLHKLLESDASAELASTNAITDNVGSVSADSNVGGTSASIGTGTNGSDGTTSSPGRVNASDGADVNSRTGANNDGAESDHKEVGTVDCAGSNNSQEATDALANKTGDNDASTSSPKANSEFKVDQVLFDAWKRDSITVLGSENITYTTKDYNILAYLKEYSKRLDPVKVFRRPDLLRTLSQANFENLDFIVKVHNVFKDYTFVVADATAKALVVELDPMLVANVFKSFNPIKKGDWIKLRSFFKVEGCSSLTLKPSVFACITRLPPMPQVTIGDESARPPERSVASANGDKPNGLPSSKRQSGRNRTVNLELWASVSRLNNNFPKRLKRSPSFIEKILSGHNTVTFQKASPDQPLPVEREEGEISQ